MSFYGASQQGFLMAVSSAFRHGRNLPLFAHEAAHETKNQFKGATFGAGDHSAAAGLMDPTGSLSSFQAGEKKKLRGIL